MKCEICKKPVAVPMEGAKVYHMSCLEEKYKRKRLEESEG